MDPLVHRLKELDQITFQEFCFHLMAEKYPSANVRYVEGASGDQGLDLFQGDLKTGPAIWQCKAFRVSSVGKSQKNQIRVSLRKAVQTFSPRLWVLCLNMDFDTKTHAWFQKLTASYSAKGVQIKLVQGSDLIHELIFRHTLRDHYFPNALIQDEVRKLIPRPSVLTDGELELAPGETNEEYIERLKAKDPRFIYEITIGGDRGPSAFPPPLEPGLVVAATDGRKIVKAFARDPGALELDPLGFSIAVNSTGAEKMLSLIRTGKRQHFDRDEILEFNSNLPLLSSFTATEGKFKMELGPARVNGSVPLRLSFVGKNEKIVYELLEFETMRAGTEEVEITTKKTDLPLQIGFIFPTSIDRDSKGNINVRKRFIGSEAIQARKAINALRILRDGCRIELFSLQHERNAAEMEVPPSQIDIPEGMSIWINKLARVSEHFEVPISLPGPADANKQDFESLSFLYALASGEGLPIDNLKVRLVKSERNSKLLPDSFRFPTRFSVIFNNVTIGLFGTQIHVGSYTVDLEKAELINREQTLLEFEKAEIGTAVLLSIRSPEPAKVFHVQEHEELGRDAVPIA